MSLNRWAKRRDANEPEIIEEFMNHNCTVYRLDLPLDLLVAYKDKVYLVEVKTKTGVLKPKQIEFMDNWPTECFVVRSCDDVKAMINTINNT